MGCEWRIFAPSNSEEYQRAFGKKFGLEYRTDIYLILPTPVFNLKLRHAKDIELKVRMNRNHNGVEKWKKVISKSFPKKITKSTIEDIISVLKLHCQTECLKYVERVKDNANYAIVNKIRKQSWSYEEVLLEISFFVNEEKDNEKKYYYRSVCYEDGNSDPKATQHPMGYNEFLYELLKTVSK